MGSQIIRRIRRLAQGTKDGHKRSRGQMQDLGRLGHLGSADPADLSSDDGDDGATERPFAGLSNANTRTDKV